MHLPVAITAEIKTGEELAFSPFIFYIKVISMIYFLLGVAVLAIIAGTRLFKQVRDLQSQLSSLQEELSKVRASTLEIERSINNSRQVVDAKIDNSFKVITQNLNQDITQIQNRVSFLSKRLSQEY